MLILFKKKLLSEAIEIVVFLILFSLVGTWMTVHHNLRDTHQLIQNTQETVTRLENIYSEISQSAPHSKNAFDVESRLFIEQTRLNAHIRYFNTFIETPASKLLSRFHKYTPKQLIQITPKIKDRYEVMYSG